MGTHMIKTTDDPVLRVEVSNSVNALALVDHREGSPCRGSDVAGHERVLRGPSVWNSALATICLEAAHYDVRHSAVEADEEV